MKQQYDSYKPSGIDWIGDIPSHWNIAPIKNSFRLFAGATPKTERSEYWDGDIVWITPADYKTDDHYINEGRKNITKEGLASCATEIVPRGSLIFSKRAPIGTVALADTPICTNQGCISCVPKSKTISNYFYYLCRIATSEFEILGSGATFLEISSTNFANFKMPLPPLAEQEAIAAWLDEKCEDIDAAIAKVDREIELIDELKQSDISRVVTRGLNPDTPLRPSGIDWIGDVPEHWFNTRIKFNILRSAAGVWGDDEKGDENDIVCFRIADFDYDERCLSTEKITIRNIESKQLEGRYLSKGDLLIEKSGGGESTPVGRVVYCNYNGKATYTNFIHSITLSDSVDSRFFLYYFNMLYSNKINLLFFNQTTGLQNLQVSDYLGQSICLPPLSEQQAIADYLDKKCAEIDGLKAKLSKKRETLTELRQSIISEVVTGKRKVI